MAICDFCSVPNPAWSFPAKDFELVPLFERVGATGIAMNPVPAMSRGPWLACDDCGPLVEAGLWEAVTDRWFAHSPTAANVAPDNVDHIRSQLYGMQSSFARNSDGASSSRLTRM